MKVVVCQGESMENTPPRDYMIQLWKDELSGIQEVKEVEFADRYNHLDEDEKIKDADVLIGSYIRDNHFDDDYFKEHSKLKYISTFAHGFGTVDKGVAERHGVTFTNTIYGDVTIAQFTFGLLLEICHSIDLHNNYYRTSLEKGIPLSFGARNLVKKKQVELYGKTFGIIGLGNIGYCVAKMAHGFGMNVISYGRTKKVGEKYDFIQQVTLDEVLEKSDVISIHCPLNENTNKMINAKAIEKMKDGVIILNTARGGIIDEDDLYVALKSGKIYAAGLDVVDGEPIKVKNKLMECDNAIITPHIAWVTEEAKIRQAKIAAENFRNWVKGAPTSKIV